MTESAPLYNELAEAPETGRAFWLTSGRRRIRAAIWDEGTRGTVLIFTGRTEYIEKYGRVISLLVERGFSVATLDWRGQGLSERPLGDRMKGHVGGFAAYQRDIGAFLAAPQVMALPGRRVLICHSMGGCIGVRALLDELVEPAATIMTAPMLGLAMKPITRLAARGMIAFARRFGFETSFTPAPHASRPYVLHQDFEGNVLTGDSDHYEWFRKHLEAESGFGLGAPTLGWMAEAFDETEALAAAPAPSGPMLIMLGGDEAVVEPTAIRSLAAKSPVCRLMEIKGARHEIFFETPLIRQRAWAGIDRFLVENGV
ncbi:alpha/beta hydrolase [Pikeienuella piscinae]|uniref:Alpha/beta hydrolase n=1 Tax=Pikeienuella piscinae TaxID=2748098 RepID=A0A7L5BWD2_9RHOB|nr:alpha/beta hydrolase [Pikeienuella piscinae]QIE55453.1 alpha/beta hydrolase [Pikeienuella piscinae]